MSTLPPNSLNSSPVALVTGGAKRIGREIALALAQAGYNVAITYRNSADDAIQTAHDIASLGVESLALQADVRKEESVERSISRVISHFGRLDLLVNNVGIFESAPLDQITLDQWDAMFETNTRGPFLTARAALPHLKSTKGRIVNLGSLGAIHPWVNHAHYCASKAALHMLTQTMAKAFAPEVSVNSVAPGYIQFESDEIAARFQKKTPMQRNGNAAEVATAVLFFATGPHFITGQTLAVDGGLGL